MAKSYSEASIKNVPKRREIFMGILMQKVPSILLPPSIFHKAVH